MLGNEASAAKRNPYGANHEKWRRDSLRRSFGEAEINRLYSLRLQYRARPDARDLPVEMSRLRFARWLYEHDRLREDRGEDPSDAQLAPTDGRPSCGELPQARQLRVGSDLLLSDTDGERYRAGLRALRHTEWYLALCHVWAHVRWTCVDLGEVGRTSWSRTTQARKAERSERREPDAQIDASPAIPWYWTTFLPPW